MIWHAISDDDWDAAAASARRAERRWPAGTDRSWNVQRHFLGALGEQFVRGLLALEWDPDRAGRGPDGGTDVGGDTDVKGYERRARELQRRVDSPTWATWFVVVLVDLDARQRVVRGHTHGDELRAAPVRDYGYGATCCLPLEELQPGLPPHLVLDAYRRAHADRWDS